MRKCGPFCRFYFSSSCRLLAGIIPHYFALSWASTVSAPTAFRLSQVEGAERRDHDYGGCWIQRFQMGAGMMGLASVRLDTLHDTVNTSHFEHHFLLLPFGTSVSTSPHSYGLSLLHPQANSICFSLRFLWAPQQLVVIFCVEKRQFMHGSWTFKQLFTLQCIIPRILLYHAVVTKFISFYLLCLILILVSFDSHLLMLYKQ